MPAATTTCCTAPRRTQDARRAVRPEPRQGHGRSASHTPGRTGACALAAAVTCVRHGCILGVHRLQGRRHGAVSEALEMGAIRVAQEPSTTRLGTPVRIRLAWEYASPETSVASGSQLSAPDPPQLRPQLGGGGEGPLAVGREAESATRGECLTAASSSDRGATVIAEIPLSGRDRTGGPSGQ